MAGSPTVMVVRFLLIFFLVFFGATFNSDVYMGYFAF